MTLPTPLIIVNLKTYEAGSDVKAESLVRSLAKAAKGTRSGLAIACQSSDLFRLSSDTTLPLLAQHVDPVGYGAHTGSTIIETARCNGAVGTLLNHSERRIPFSQIKAAIDQSKRVGFITVVCAQDASEAGRLAKLRPDYVAVEPPELIGGTISVSTAKPSVITASVKAVGKNSILLVGAGVKTADDVATSLQLGAKGVLVASGIVQSRDPGKALKELIQGTQ